jgi:hypothetical protein
MSTIARPMSCSTRHRALEHGIRMPLLSAVKENSVAMNDDSKGTSMFGPSKTQYLDLFGSHGAYFLRSGFAAAGEGSEVTRSK